MLGTCGFAQASSQADGPPFEIKPHHTGISVPNLEESIAWYQKMLGFQRNHPGG